MFEDKNLGTILLTNPALAQSYALDELEERFNGTMYVADANNAFCFLLEYGASLNNVTAQIFFDGDRSFYPMRAQSMEDLYKHMSDWDYQNLFSTPCTCEIKLTLNKRYLINNALSYNDFYQLVVIPKYTVFTVGKYKFGIYYPIKLRINKLTNTVLATWDADDANPLHTITQNIITTQDESEFNGNELIHLYIPTYQFTMTPLYETLVAKTGFIKTYTFSYYFYALRIWTIIDGEYTELAQSLSKTVYDPTVATVRVLIDQDNQQVTLNIPQIYFTNGLMGSKLYIELYTTLGALDDDISTISTDTLGAAWNLSLPNTSDYSKVLKNSPTASILPTQTKLVGGSNGITFEELRDRVVNNNFYKDVPITPSDLNVYISGSGFSSVKYLDNITDRVYHAHRCLTDSTGMTLATANAHINISNTYIENVSSIIINQDTSLTIMPSTMYVYDATTDCSTPLVDSDVNYFSTLSKEDLIDEFNNGTYTTNPFHLHIMRDDRYPKAVSYNLVSCTATGLTFLKSNDEIAPQIVIYGVTITHNNAGTGGYTVTLLVSRSSDLKSVSHDDIIIYISTYTSLGHVAGIRATYVKDQDPFEIYTFDIKTDYYFSSTGQLNITNFESKSIVQPFMLNLEDTYYITTMVSKNDLPAGNNDIFTFVNDLEQDMLDANVVLVRQSVKLHLGHTLANIISNDINITETPITYEVYPEDVPLTYESDVYQRDTDNKLVYPLVLLHNQGDSILNEAGKPYLLHKAGNVRYDDFGDPIISKSRELIYQTSMMQFDARIYISEVPEHITFRNTLADTLESYFTTLETIQDQLLQRTHLFFKPTKTFGNCSYFIGNGLYKTLPLDLKFSVKYYVHDFAYNDTTIQDKILSVTIDTINKYLLTKKICTTIIFDDIKTQLSDYIVGVDILGINDDITLQTIIVSEDQAQPMIAQILELDRTDTINLKYDVDITYIDADEG